MTIYLLANTSRGYCMFYISMQCFNSYVHYKKYVKFKIKMSMGQEI